MRKSAKESILGKWRHNSVELGKLMLNLEDALASIRIYSIRNEL